MMGTMFMNGKQYGGGGSAEIELVTSESDGLMSKEDKSFLDNPTFTEATTRANIESGDSSPTIFGKIKKYFSDLKTHAFNTPANNLTTDDEDMH